MYRRPSGRLGRIIFLSWVFVIDVSAEGPTIDLVLVLRDFSDMFLVAEHVVG